MVKVFIGISSHRHERLTHRHMIELNPQPLLSSLEVHLVLHGSKTQPSDYIFLAWPALMLELSRDPLRSLRKFQKFRSSISETWHKDQISPPFYNIRPLPDAKFTPATCILVTVFPPGVKYRWLRLIKAFGNQLLDYMSELKFTIICACAFLKSVMPRTFCGFGLCL